jgi:hypothetical protein
VFKGSYTQYKAYQLKLREVRDKEEAESRSEVHNQQSASKGQSAEKHLSKYERRKAENRLKEIEKEIQALEAQQQIISGKLANPPAQSDQVLKLGEDYVALQNQIEALMSEWTGLHERLAD